MLSIRRAGPNPEAGCRCLSCRLCGPLSRRCAVEIGPQDVRPQDISASFPLSVGLLSGPTVLYSIFLVERRAYEHVLAFCCPERYALNDVGKVLRPLKEPLLPSVASVAGREVD